MIDFLQILVGGIAAGSSYALIGLAMIIIYKSSEVINFAQGEMALASAYFNLTLLDGYGLPLWLALTLTAVFAALLGAVIEFTVLRRTKNPTIMGTLIITIALEMILMGLVSWKFGADPKTLTFPISPYESFEIGEILIGKLEALTFGISLATMLLLYLFYSHTKQGVAMKATQQNPMAARLMGISTKRNLMITWGLASVVGAVASVMLSPMTMQPYMMWDPLLKGFAAAVMGGMNSLPGAIFGAFALGIIENLFGGYVSIEFKSVVALALIVLMLCIKPSGLFARHYVKKV